MVTTKRRLPWEDITDGMRAAWVEHTLWVAFEHGNTWKFDGVPKRFYIDMLKAANPRRYFRTHISDRFNCERLGAT